MKVTNALKCLAAMVLMAWLFPAVALAQYVRADLTSDQPGVAANTSPHLVNGWGLVQLGTSPFWISDNGTGLSTLYNGLGQLFRLPKTRWLSRYRLRRDRLRARRPVWWETSLWVRATSLR